jgi:hypothetical protein
MKNNKAFSTLLAAVEKAKNGTPANRDDQYWRCEQDKAGNGFAVIRFLPGKTDDDLPFVKTFSHGFQSPTTGKWFIEDCPTTIGQTCPVCTANNPLWATGAEKDKEVARKRKRKQAYIANVLVVSDPKNPDNEGKVFLFKFGPKIFDKIKDKIDPPKDEQGNLIDPDDEAMNPFDADEGANFKLKMRKVEGYANYDKSEFEKASSIDFDSIKGQMHDLGQFVDPKNFKTYDELEKKFNTIWSGASGAAAAPKVQRDEEDDDKDFVKETVKKAATKPAPKKEESSDDDDDLNYFRKLAEED